MFDFVRNHSKLMMLLLFALIIPSFALFGIDGYNNFINKGQVVATVDGQPITQAEWDATHRRESDRLRENMPSLDAKLLDTPEMRQLTLDRLIRERVMLSAVKDANLVISDTRLARELAQSPMVNALRKPDGSMDLERYKQLLGSQGMTPESFEAKVRQDLAAQQVEAGFSQTGFVSQTAVRQLSKAFYQQREVQILAFEPKDFASKINPTESELEAYYQAHLDLYSLPAQAQVEYVVLDLEAIKKTLQLAPADLKSYYEQNVDRLSGTEERRASHILIASPKNAPEADRAKARAKAEDLLLQLQKAPQAFADFARQHSQDPGSASRGGDLNFFSRGSMTKPFEDAAFALKKGEISAMVASDFGFHIIKLTDLKVPPRKSFEELRATIEADLKQQMALEKYSESAEAFTNGVYEQADSLQAVAEQFKLTIHKAMGVTASPAPGARGPLANPKLLAALFAEDSVQKKRNTEAVSMGPNQLAAARVLDYQGPKLQALQEVRTKVRAAVVADQAAAHARLEGEKLLASLTQQPHQAKWPASLIVSRDQRLQKQALNPKVQDAVLRAPVSGLPTVIGVNLADQGYVLARVLRVVDAPLASAEQTRQEQTQVVQWWSQAEKAAHYASLKTRFKVSLNEPASTPKDYN
jgi:peptidyl-prolyl cis-trans isomerase D